MQNKLKNIFIIAGESSGDMHAASLVKELRSTGTDVSFTGIGGPQMKKESVKLIYDLKQVNFIGFSSVIKNIQKIRSILNHCISEVKKINPEAVILVDYPGFNLKFISSIRKFYKGIIIYYISPQLWAWHKSRVKTIKKFVDLMIVVFPFEVDFYRKEDVIVDYAGHPLVKRIDEFLSKNKRIKSPEPVISFLPGSRKDEIDRMMPALVETAVKFRKEFKCDINFLCTTNLSRSYFQKFIKGNDFNLIYDENNSELNYKAILNSDLVISKSGTSTMECALIGTPFCVVYKTGELNYAIGKRLVKVDHIAMVNILLKKRAVTEFLQSEMKPQNIFEEGKRILTDAAYANEMKNNFKELRNILTDRDASKNAAEIIMNFIKKNIN